MYRYVNSFYGLPPYVIHMTQHDPRSALVLNSFTVDLYVEKFLFDDHQQLEVN